MTQKIIESLNLEISKLQEISNKSFLFSKQDILATLSKKKWTSIFTSNDQYKQTIEIPWIEARKYFIGGIPYMLTEEMIANPKQLLISLVATGGKLYNLQDVYLQTCFNKYYEKLGLSFVSNKINSLFTTDDLTIHGYLIYLFLIDTLSEYDYILLTFLLGGKLNEDIQTNCPGESKKFYLTDNMYKSRYIYKYLGKSYTEITYTTGILTKTLKTISQHMIETLNMYSQRYRNYSEVSTYLENLTIPESIVRTCLNNIYKSFTTKETVPLQQFKLSSELFIKTYFPYKYQQTILTSLLNPDPIKSVPVVNANNDNTQTTHELCSICNNKVINCVLNCGHPFCFDCITEWKVKSNTCPNCRVDITDERPLYI